MTSMALDPAAAIRVLSTELHDALRQLLDSTDREDPGLLDKAKALVQGRGSLGSRLTRVRNQVARATEPKPAGPKPTQPSTPKPTGSDPAKPKTETPAATSTPKTVPTRVAPPAPRSTTATIPRTAPTVSRPSAPPAKPSVTEQRQLPKPATPVPATGHGRHRAPHERPTWPGWLLPVLLAVTVLTVLTVLTLTAGISWTLATTVLGAAVWRTRHHWLPLATTIRLPAPLSERNTRRLPSD